MPPRCHACGRRASLDDLAGHAPGCSMPWAFWAWEVSGHNPLMFAVVLMMGAGDG